MKRLYIKVIYLWLFGKVSLHYINPCIFFTSIIIFSPSHLLTSCFGFSFTHFLKDMHCSFLIYASSEFAFILKKLLYLHRIFVSSYNCIVFSLLYYSSLFPLLYSFPIYLLYQPFILSSPPFFWVLLLYLEILHMINKKLVNTSKRIVGSKVVYFQE